MNDSSAYSQKSKHNPKYPVRPVVQPIGPSIAYVQLTRGYFSLIDSCDAGSVGRFNWRAHLSGLTVYARRYAGVGKVESLNAFLMGVEDADHRNGNGLDNRRSCNLRHSTRSQQNQNRCRQSNNSSGFKGVSFHAPSKRWGALIIANGKRKYLGGFSTPEEAYETYCKAAAEMHGEFARVA